MILVSINFVPIYFTQVRYPLQIVTFVQNIESVIAKTGNNLTDAIDFRGQCVSNIRPLHAKNQKNPQSLFGLGDCDIRNEHIHTEGIESLPLWGQGGEGTESRDHIILKYLPVGGGMWPKLVNILKVLTHGIPWIFDV